MPDCKVRSNVTTPTNAMVGSSTSPKAKNAPPTPVALATRPEAPSPPDTGAAAASRPGRSPGKSGRRYIHHDDPRPACSTDPVDGEPDLRIFYELYRDRDASNDHEAQPHTHRFLAEREPLLESKQVDFLVPADGKLPAVPSAVRANGGAVR